MSIRRIVASGGSGFNALDGGRIERHILELAGLQRPRVVFLPTASADDREYIAAVTGGFSALGAECVALPLFRTTEWPASPAETLAWADAVYVGGGSTFGMLAVWRAFGVDALLREAYERGCIMAGLSAGGLCWFVEGVTDSLDRELKPMRALGWLPGSFCPHYDGEATRRPALLRMVASGELGETFAAGDGTALVFENEALKECVASREGARILRVGAGGEIPLPMRLLA